MEIINAKWALVNKSDKGLVIYLSKNKFSSTYGLYEDVKIVIDNGTLTIEGLLHKRQHLFSFDNKKKFWLENLIFKPLPEDEYLIEEGYKNFIHKWKDIKSKYIPIFTTYTYDKEKRKEMTNNFTLNYSPDDISEMKEELKSFSEFKADLV